MLVPDVWRFLADNVQYILGEHGPYADVDPTAVIIVFRAHWDIHPCDGTPYYVGPDGVRVASAVK